MLDWPSFRSTTCVLTPCPSLSLHLVCFLFLYSVLSDYIIVFHPYYKLDYIKLSWGRPEEQKLECLAGNLEAKNWQDEALKVVERTMSISSEPGKLSHGKL